MKNFPFQEFLKFAIGTALRHLITAIGTLWLVNHYVGADIAKKLMAGDTVTLYQGYSFSIETIIHYLVDAFMISIFPILFGVFMRMRAKLKERLAILLPVSADSGEHQIRQILSATPLITKIAATVTLDPAKVLEATTAPVPA